jgi:hypothetical protein
MNFTEQRLKLVDPVMEGGKIVVLGGVFSRVRGRLAMQRAPQW